MLTERPKVLVSACLLGRPVRYDGSAKSIEAKCLARWSEEGHVVSVCPEILAVLSTPRPAAEIYGMGGGKAVLRGDALIIEANGKDATALYLKGAQIALATAAQHGCRYALLTDGSPSCGASVIYNGNFSGERIVGEGVAAALLRKHDIEVFSHSELEMLIAVMDR